MSQSHLLDYIMGKKPQKQPKRRRRAPRKKKREPVKPTLKQLMTGQVLTGYVEASRVKQFPKPQKRVGAQAVLNRATDLLSIVFDQKPSTDILSGLKQAGFRYRPSSKTWAAKWSLYREQELERVAGKISVMDREVDYARKAERALSSASRHILKAEEHEKIHEGISRAIPFGQPILVGHHSEKRHRRDLARIDRHLRKELEEREIAEKQAERARRYQRIASRGEDPGLILRRIEKLEARKRSLRADLALVKIEKQKPGALAKIGLYAPDEEWVTKNLEHVTETLKREQAKYKKSGGIPADKLTLKKGVRVKTRFGTGTITTVSKKTVRVKLDPDPISGRPRTIYPDSKGSSKLDKTDIVGRA